MSAPAAPTSLSIGALSEILIYAQHRYLAHRRAPAHGPCGTCWLTEARYAQVWRERASAINARFGGTVLPLELPP